MATVTDIMTSDVVTVHMNTPVCDLKGIFITHRISGAPIVDSQGTIHGLVSLSDLVHFESTGGDIDQAQVYEIATHNIVTVAPDDSLYHAAKVLAATQVHRLMVIDKDRLVGMISPLDFVRLFAETGRLTADGS